LLVVPLQRIPTVAWVAQTETAVTHRAAQQVRVEPIKAEPIKAEPRVKVEPVDRAATPKVALAGKAQP
jgi:hypothetical protein